MPKTTVRFLFVGCLNTIVGIAVYYFFLKIVSANYIVSLVVSHIAGVLHSYIWNNYWTFRMHAFSMKSLIKFSSVYMVTFVINLSLLSLFIKSLSINAVLAQVIALGLTTIISYLGHKYWSFKIKSAGV